MQKVRKAHGDKVILDDVTLNFLPGAKIGVVGPNGAGKSTVLKIMAGLEHANNGEAYIQPGATVGILQQEPSLNEEKTVLGNVEEGLGEIKTKLDRYNTIAEQMATDYSDELMEEFGVTNRALRFYEERGLLKPIRVSKARVYSSQDRDRLATILEVGESICPGAMPHASSARLGLEAVPFPYKMTTICFVGPSAYVPIHSALTLFPEDFAARVTTRPARITIPVMAAGA